MARRGRRASLAAWRGTAIRRMTASRAATLRALALIPEEELLRPRALGRWSVKDILAHIVAWEEEGIRRLALIGRGHGDRVVFYADMRSADRFNARAVAAARRLGWAALLGRAARVRRRLVAALRRLPVRSLRDPSHEVPVVEWLREFAWTHEQGHRGEIRSWWWRRRRTRAP